MFKTKNSNYRGHTYVKFRQCRESPDDLGSSYASLIFIVSSGLVHPVGKDQKSRLRLLS